ncbi:N-acetylmuramoyl-L-alanine amidase [Sphingomonadaceae bacterium LXI357]|uniref:N-acetylmuramoyl-L-alanine amidase n=1 Tax=Stakelama marina TaxID=2826939 RepID=A0A8T4IFC8_9SPHN|nr:N-acetylmuramoyl-L-alanine amidase [Stakelama marina]
MGILLAILAGWFTGTPGWASTIQDIRVHNDRIVIRFDGRVSDASAFMLDSPRRIAVDVGGADPGRKPVVGGPVADVRQASHGGDSARVVFDLSRPAIVTRGDFGSDGHTLTLALRTVDDARFASAAAQGRLRFLPPFSFGHSSRDRGYSVSVPVPAVHRSAALPHVYGDDPSRPLVVIDAGHGGHDPGAIGVDGLREKDITLKTALAIKDELLKSHRVRVALTREDDRFLVLRQRFAIARKLGADLFISIHCDSAANPDATGATAYTLSEVASDKEAARLAARENKADIIAGVDLDDEPADISSILIDLTQRQTMNASSGFARLLGREAKPLIATKDNFHRMASLMVLKAPDMPSILFETGYISNPHDAAFLNSTAGREKIAESVRHAVEIHFAKQYASR